MSTMKEFDTALLHAHGADLYMQNYYSDILVRCYNALSNTDKKKCRIFMDAFHTFLLKNVGMKQARHFANIYMK